MVSRLHRLSDAIVGEFVVLSAEGFEIFVALGFGKSVGAMYHFCRAMTAGVAAAVAKVSFLMDSDVAGFGFFGIFPGDFLRVFG